MAKQRAKNRADVSFTSITEAAAYRHNETAPVGATLFCEKIPGFYLLKQTRGSAWRWRYTDATGKRKTATVGKSKFPELTPNEAATIAYQWHQTDANPLADKQERRQSAQEAATATQRRILSEYLSGPYSRHMDLWAAKNKKANEQRFDTLLSEFLNRDMAKLSKHDINEWQTRMEAKGLAHTSIRRAWSALRAMLNQAVADDVLQTNPLQGHKLRPPPYEQQRKPDDDKAKRRLLTPSEVSGILTGLDKFAEEIRKQRRSSRKNGKAYLPDLDAVDYPHWFIPFCNLAMTTGWRPGDLYTLRWEEVDLRFSGKLRKYAEKSKDVAARRGREPTLLETPLPASAKTMLTVWHKQQGQPDTGYVFPSERGSKKAPGQQVPMVNTAHLKPWAKVLELGKVSGELQFYALRHHAIIAMVAGGIPLLTVAKLVGHKDATMIQKHYAHLCPESAADAMDVVAATIKKAKTKKRATA